MITMLCVFALICSLMAFDFWRAERFFAKFAGNVSKHTRFRNRPLLLCLRVPSLIAWYVVRVLIITPALLIARFAFGLTQNELIVRMFRKINDRRKTPKDYLKLNCRAEGGHVWIVTYPKSG